MTSYFRGGCSDLDEIQQPDAEWHADYGEVVKIEPEVEFQYGGRLYFETGSNYISDSIWNISTKFILLRDFAPLKAVTSTNTKPK